MRGSQWIVRELIVRNHVITEPQTIDQEISIFQKQLKNRYQNRPNFLDIFQMPKLPNDECFLYKGDLTDDEECNALKNMSNNKSPGNNQLIKHFFLICWDDFKDNHLKFI